MLIDSCGVYDPPRESRDFNIANQTNRGIYLFIDSLPANSGKIRWLDTLSANGRRYYSNQIKFVNSFSNNEFFIPEEYFNVKRSKGEDSIVLFFTADSNITKSLSEIQNDSLLRSKRIAVDEIRKPSSNTNSINVIIYYKDSIKFEHDLNYQSVR